jgi:hypothetical protein
VAREWEFIARKMDGEDFDPLDDLWFVMYFRTDDGVRD